MSRRPKSEPCREVMEPEAIVRSEVSQTHEEKYKSFLSPGECECDSIRAAVVGLKRICKGRWGNMEGGKQREP